MATKKLEKNGYGQLELNNAAFRRNGNIEAQCALAEGIDSIENGMLLVVNNLNRTVEMPKASGNVHPIALHYSAEHMYDERANALKDFKLEKNSFLPRLGYLTTGDKYTTNTVAYDDSVWANEDLLWAALGTTAIYAHVNTDGYQLLNKTAADAVAMAVEATTMPDGQRAIKFVAL